jgi:hypothetical protein
MRKAMFGTAAVTLVAGIVIACGGSGGGGPLDQPGTSSSGATSSSGGSSGTGSSSGGPSGVYSPAQAGQGTTYCDNTYKKLTDAFATCCSAADKETFEYKFGVGLITGVSMTCGPRLESSIGKSRLEHDAAAAQSCYAAWSSLFSGTCASGPAGINPNLDTPEVKAQLETCKLVFRGLVAENGACSMDADCADGLTCVGWTADSEGTCKKPPALNETCGQGASDGGTLSLSINLAFGSHPECATGGYCSARKCVAQKNPGESCTNDEQCLGGKLCRVGICGDVGDADVNGACKQNDDCKSGLYCQRPSSTEPGTCQTKLLEGAACTSSVSSCKGRCDRPDSGTNGTCKSFCGSG